jgi:DNA transformation protein
VERRTVRTDPLVLTELLGALAPLGVRARAMFGGHGLYLGDRFFGLVNDGCVFFRTDDLSRADYSSRGMQPFQPNRRPIGPRTVPRNFQVPPEILADSELLAEWALRAAGTAR